MDRITEALVIAAVAVGADWLFMKFLDAQTDRHFVRFH